MIGGERTGITWDLNLLDGLDFADDLVLLSSTMNQFQQKTSKLEQNTFRVGPKLYGKNVNFMESNNKSEEKLKMQWNEVEDVGSFKCLEA
jgi:hypothetical protein